MSTPHTVLLVIESVNACKVLSKSQTQNKYLINISHFKLEITILSFLEWDDFGKKAQQ